MTGQTEDERFRAEVERIIQQFAGDDPGEYARRWAQLATWARNKTNPAWKKKLKARLIEKRGLRCSNCSKVCKSVELEMHRLNPDLTHDKDEKLGYIESNIELLCKPCHHKREAAKAGKFNDQSEAPHS